MLLAFSLNAAANAFMFMDFSAVSALSLRVLNTDEDGLEWLYSASLLTVMPLSIPAAYFLVKENYWTSFLGAEHLLERTVFRDRAANRHA